MMNFNFFEKKIKSVDINSKSKKNIKIDTKNEQSMINNLGSPYILNHSKKNSKNLIEKELSRISNLKMMKTINQQRNSAFYRNSFFRKKRKKSSIESLFLLEQNKKNKDNYKTPVLMLRPTEMLKNSNKDLYKSSNRSLKKISSINNESNEFTSSMYAIKKRKSRFLELKKPNDIYGRKLGKTPKASNFQFKNNIYLNYAKEYIKPTTINKRPESSKLLIQTSNFNSFEYFKNNAKIMKINENIENEIGSKELKKKLKLMKKSIRKSSKNLKKLIRLEESPSEFDELQKIQGELTKRIQEKIQNKEESNTCLKSNMDDGENNKGIDKNRRIKRIKELYDSFDDEEYEDDFINEYYISPSSFFIKFFDYIVFLSSMFYLISVPYYLSQNLFISGERNYSKLILIIIDFIYILDIILNFFRAYQNFEEKLVRKTKFIFFHYLKSWFLMDFIQSIPFFTIFKSIEKRNLKDNHIYYENNKLNPFLYLIMLIKIIKVYKMINENITISKLGEFITQIEIIDNYGGFIFSIFFSLCSVNFCACLFIFIGKNSYPGWLVKIDILDESYANIYITSVYFILVTITTVGYGDITGNSYAEIIYQMFLLIIGTIAYSFVISYFSNYIVKINQKSITFEKNVGILEEIRLHNPDMKNSVYQEVLKNLHNEQLYERKDKSILFDCLPYALKNKLIMEMYKPFIDNFIFFKGTENSDFIVKVVTALKPLLSFKGDILVQEGDFIKEIFFIKKGVLSLNITIDKKNTEESISKYIDIDEIGYINISYEPSFLSNNINSTLNLEGNLNDYVNNKKEEKPNKKNDKNIREIKIIEIRKNEYFGVALMFLDERCPLVVKVKTKLAELLVLRKMEAIEIYSIYPNIWKRINKKSLFNMEQIKQRIKKELISIFTKYNIAKEYNSYCSKVKTKEIKNKTKNKKEVEKKETMKENSENTTEINQSVSILNNNISNNIISNNNISNNNISNKNISINGISNIQPINSNIKSNNQFIDQSYNKAEVSVNKEISTKSTNKDINEKELKCYSKTNEKENVKNIYNIKILSPKVVNNPRKSVSNRNNILINKEQNRFNLPKSNQLDINNSNIPINSSICSSKNNKIISNIKNENEKVFYNSFCNLKTIKEKSFHINSSYENLNKITNNRYIKNNFLQSKIRQILINEFSTVYFESPKHNKVLSKDPLNGKIIITRDKSFKNLTKDFDLEEDKRSINSLDLSKLKSHKKSNDSITTLKKEKNFESDKNESDKNIHHRQTMINNDTLQSKFKCKSPKKKKHTELIQVNKKLDIITEKIKGANRNINNPDEFYMDFFNNIINKETYDVDKGYRKNNHTMDTLNEKEKDKDNQNNINVKNSTTFKNIINNDTTLGELKGKYQNYTNTKNTPLSKNIINNTTTTIGSPKGKNQKRKKAKES